MQLNTRMIFEVRLTPAECENFSEILSYTYKIHYFYDARCFEPFEDEYDFPGFILTRGRLNALISTLEKLSLVLPMYNGVPRPSGLSPFLANLKNIAFGHNLLKPVETCNNALISA